MTDHTGARPPYRLAFTMTPDVIVGASRLWLARPYGWMKLGALLVAVAGVVVFVFGDPLLGLGVLALGALMYLLVRSTFIERAMARLQGRSVLGQTVELDIGEDGIDTRIPGATSHVAWSTLTEVRQDSRAVIFVRDRLLVVFIPTSAFASAAERDAVIDFARRRITAAGLQATPR